MGLGDIGLWTPAESQYAKPGSYEDALRAEAMRSANYLSSMDQFYANLEEAKSEFGQTLDFKNRQLAQEKELGLKGIGIQQQQVDINKDVAEWNREFQQGELKAKQDELTFKGQELEAGNELAQKRLDWLEESTGTGSSIPSWERKTNEPATYFYGPDQTTTKPATPEHTSSEVTLPGESYDSSWYFGYDTPNDFYEGIPDLNWSDNSDLYTSDDLSYGPPY